jgi:hypothetical protein
MIGQPSLNEQQMLLAWPGTPETGLFTLGTGAVIFSMMTAY